MELNKVYHLNFLDNTLPAKCGKLIIADPPYFEVMGDFDFIWESFSHYLQDVEKWALECLRLLADNGTLLWYGDDKKIAYTQMILDKYFDLNNSLVWYKYNLRGGMFGSTGGDNVRSFPICTERILMYSLDKINLTKSVSSIRDYIRTEISKSKGKIILKDVNQVLGTATNGGGVASACLSLSKSEPTMITKEMYVKLQNWCYPDLSTDYETLRKQYEDSRRYFNNSFNLSEVLQFNTDLSNNHDHDTVKPETLTRALILTCSRPGDLVIVGFAGSGTECAMSAKENRPFVGFDILKKYVDMSNARVQNVLSTPQLF